VPTNETSLSNLPEDKQALQSMLRALWQEREQQKQHIEELQKKAQAQARRADGLYLERLQLQKELLRYKKATYGPRADRLSENELAMALLEFAEVEPLYRRMAERVRQSHVVATDDTILPMLSLPHRRTTPTAWPARSMGVPVVSVWEKTRRSKWRPRARRATRLLGPAFHV